ncbi:MAG: Crp/Fnr family transcriptional regulator [Chthoniobacterales bacterium]|nr:Crp/Fnr family transcriptional regulator [Chthoniobacterales bacterium]
MPTRRNTPPPFRNRILRRLPRAMLQRLRRDLKEVELAPRDSLYEPNVPGKYVYFPETGAAAIVTVLQDGTETEVATVGYEGMVGLPAFSGAKTAPRRAFWQLPGRALRMRAAVLRRETRHGGPLAKALHLYAHGLFTQLAQLATCNRLHSIEQRCCCWLLMTHDRIEGDEFELTHEFLSEMLGARRAGITVILGNLQRGGLIQYRRGHVTIRNRKGLEQRACECYGVVRRDFDRLLATKIPPAMFRGEHPATR